MRTQPEIDAVLTDVRAKLYIARQATGLALEVPPGGYDQHDGWLSVIVTPIGTGVRAYEYVEALGDVERAIRADGHQQVVLVPAMGD